MMKSRMRPVVTITSQTAALYPLFVRIRRCPMMPLIVPAIMVRTWFRSCGGKRSIRRFMVSVASRVWSVERPGGRSRPPRGPSGRFRRP